MFTRWINDALAQVQPAPRPLADREGDALRALIEARFADRADAFLWGRFKGEVGCRLENMSDERWREAIRLLPGHHFIVFFERANHAAMLEFGDLQSVIRFIDEIPPSDTYITDPEASFVLCLNHHDYLIGVGMAVAIVKQIGSDATEQ